MLKKRKFLSLALLSLLIFVVWTLLVFFVDKKAIGPNDSSVGFASMNGWYASLVGVNFSLYNVVDLVSFVTIPIGFIFFMIGLVELIKRKNLLKVDANILALGLFYILTFLAYVFFQFVVVNYRSVLIDGVLEASYPSSTTVLSLIIFITAIDQINIYVKNKKVKYVLIIFAILFSLFLIIGRLISGVHWLSDIIGGLLLSVTLILSYYAFKELLTKKQESNQKSETIE